MNNNLLKLEYDKIIEKIQNHCKTYIGKDYAYNLRPSHNKDEIQKMLNETSQGVILIQRNSTPPISDIANIIVYLKALNGGGTLGIKALLEIKNVLQTANE